MAQPSPQVPEQAVGEGHELVGHAGAVEEFGYQDEKGDRHQDVAGGPGMEGCGHRFQEVRAAHLEKPDQGRQAHDVADGDPQDQQKKKDGENQGHKNPPLSSRMTLSMMAGQARTWIS